MTAILNSKFLIMNYGNFSAAAEKWFRHTTFKIKNSKFGGFQRVSVFTILTLVFTLSPGGVLARPPVVPSAPPLDIQAPAFESKTLSCGMKVLFLKDNRMPLVQGNLFMPGGSVIDPVGKEGLSSLMEEALRNGGAGDLTPEAFDEALENRAASLTASEDQESFTASFNCLSGDLTDVLGYFSDMLRRPKFEEKRLDTDKKDLAESLGRLEDTPDTLTRVLFRKTLFGNHPYAQWASPKSVLGLTRSDVTQFYQNHYGPEGSVLVVTGKFDEEKIFQRLESVFSGWKGGVKPSQYAQPKPLGPAIYFFPKQVGQVLIRFGVLGIQRHDPKDISLQVANYVLGGSGFTSRLMREIRSNRGLAYFVDSFFLPYNVPGPFEVVGGTRPDSVKEFLTLMFQLTDDFAKEGPTEAELDEAKLSMIEEFAYNFESSFKLAPYKASLDFNGYPADYLKTYRDKVKAVTREKASDAAREILSQKDWVLVVCGPADLEPVLSAFGTVHKVTSIFEPLTAK
ncbi:MAG TPA: pitrilysin family protein [bacterium]